MPHALATAGSQANVGQRDRFDYLLAGSSLLAVAALVPLVAASVAEGKLRTIALFVAVGLTGAFTAARLARALDDRRVLLLGLVFPIKLAAALVALRYGWVPQLDQASGAFGFDAQRYFFEAKRLADNNFDRSALPPLNYTGVLYYYGAIFRIFGHNAVAPALVNSALTLGAVAALMRFGYAVRQRRRSTDWCLCLVLLIPEMIWFDAITSRDGPVTAAVTVVALNFALYLLGQRATSYRVVALVGGLGLVGLLRFALLLPLVAAMVTTAVLGSRVRHHRTTRGARTRLLVAAAAAVVALAAPAVNRSLGSYATSYTDVARIDSSVRSAEGFSENSVGRLFVATNQATAVLFAPARVGILLVAPLPRLSLDPAGMLRQEWAAWQATATSSSALLYVLLFPLALASLLQLRRDRWRGPSLYVHIPLWTLALSIAIGNQLIVPRYRIMSVPLLAGAMWLGGSTTKATRRTSQWVWFGAAAFGFGLFIYLS